jgi:hypothetical protein
MPDDVTAKYDALQLAEVIAFYKIKMQDREAERAAEEQQRAIAAQRKNDRSRMRRGR